MKVDAGKPRQLKKQSAWYYLPFGREDYVSLCKQVSAADVGTVFLVKIPARKLLRELLAIGIKP